MSSAISRFGKWASSLLVLVVGCNTDTRTEYLHLPTCKIETELSLSASELTPFRQEGVVAAPLLRMLTPKSTQIWIKLWAPSVQTVAVRSVVLAGPSGEESRSFPAELTTQTDKPAGKGLMYGLILIGEISNDALGAMTKAGSAQLAIDWKVNAADFHPLRFTITPKTTKHWATH